MSSKVLIASITSSAMRNRLSLEILVTMVVAFSGTYGFLALSRKPQAVSAGESVTAPAVRPMAPRPEVAVIARQARPAPAIAGPAPATAAPAAAPSPVAQLPVNVNFRRGRGEGTYVEGSIFNSSGEDLPVEVLFRNPQSKQTSKIELTVPANGASAFGRDDGLEIESGDEVTIKNPAFAEYHGQVN